MTDSHIIIKWSLPITKIGQELTDCQISRGYRSIKTTFLELIIDFPTLYKIKIIYKIIVFSLTIS